MEKKKLSNRKRKKDTEPTLLEIASSMNLINSACVSVKEELEAKSNVKFSDHELKHSKVFNSMKVMRRREVKGD